MTKAIKEIIIMLLVCLVTMLILAIALYQYIPNKKVVPEIKTYVATDDVQDLLADDIDTKSEEVILTYESSSDYTVTSGDLNTYQNTNDYIPGKSNPFAKYSGTPSTESIETNGEGSSQNSTNTQTNTQSSPSVYSQNSGTK